VQSEASRFRASPSFRDEISIGLVWALLVAKGQLDLLWKESAADELVDPGRHADRRGHLLLIRCCFRAGPACQEFPLLSNRIRPCSVNPVTHGLDWIGKN
jgi:hypothetical protein